MALELADLGHHGLEAITEGASRILSSPLRLPDGLEIHPRPLELTDYKLWSYFSEVVIAGVRAIL